MANTICLSTDMNTLYLIDGTGKTQPFPLSGNGVDLLITEGDVSAKRAGSPPSGQATHLSVTGRQWTAVFTPSSQAVDFIGISEVDINRQKFSLSNNTINVTRVVDDIVVTD